jgi:hypothetical protein
MADHRDVLGWIPPQGGMTAFPWLVSGENDRPFCQAATKRGILLAPGDCFDASSHFRLGFAAAGDNFSRALDRFFSDARAAPPPTFGLMTNSRIVTPESSTWYASDSRIDSGGLKFHCWRTISLTELPPSGDHRKTNSCVRAVSFSSKTSDMHLSLCG